MLKIEQLDVKERSGRYLLKDISMEIPAGRVIGLTGKSGSGKTTLLRSILGMLHTSCHIDAGKILLDDIDLSHLSRKSHRELCGKKLGFIPQNPMTAFDSRLKIGYQMLQQIILYGTSILVIVEGLYFYLNGTMALSICLLMTVASFMLFSQLQSAGNTSALLRLLDVSIDKVNEIDKTPVMDEHGKPVKPENYNIVFDDVSFSYGEHQVLDHVSLTIPERTVTAIVGPSGAGKSTLCNLIARFWDVDGGKITIGGVDVRDYTLDSLLTNISEVFQKVYLFADTIENNIKFGNPAASHEEVVKAAQKACCHEFIMSLPDGYGTVIGEGGATLSGGEKQRISIARAILKDAPIIILDEATSSVDPENENLLMGAIAELTKNKTVIMIAHRLKTVRNADQIFVLSGGHIVQTGKHEDLIRQPGIYADFIGIRKKAIGWKLK